MQALPREQQHKDAVLFRTKAIAGGATVVILRSTGHEVIATEKRLNQLTSDFDAFDKRLDGERRAAGDNADALHELAEWSARERVSLRAEAAQVVTMARNDYEAAAKRIAKIIEVPLDVARANLDIETRTNWRSLPQQMRDKFRVEMAEGKHDAVLLALARDPLGDANQDSQYARKLWQERARAARAPEIESAEGQQVAAQNIIATTEGLIGHLSA